MAAIVDDFLRFARPKKPKFEKEDINQLLRDVVKRYRDWHEKDVEWIECYEEGLDEVSLDRHQIQQVVTNLILNGLDAMNDGGTLSVETFKVRGSAGKRIMIKISDSGSGIPEEDLPKIFQPFYSTKEKGTGMGLAICQRIINEHDGEIRVESHLKKGTHFTVMLNVDSKTDADGH